MPIDTARVLSAYVPDRHLLRAALVAATCLDVEDQPLDLVRRSLAHLPTDGLFSLDHLHLGEEVLVHARVAIRRNDCIRLRVRCSSVQELAHAFLEHSPPPWLGSATRHGRLDSAMVPEDDARTLEDIFGSPERRDQILLALARKFDADHRRELGLLGELAVVRNCRQQLIDAEHRELAERVLHASLVSDQLGYDVRTPIVAGGVLRLEVKTVVGLDEQVRFYLSRNEWDVGSWDSTWRLVVCRRISQESAAVEGWVTGEELVPSIPRDTEAARWQSVELSIPSSLLNPGPPLLTVR